MRQLYILSPSCLVLDEVCHQLTTFMIDCQFSVCRLCNWHMQAKRRKLVFAGDEDMPSADTDQF